MHTISIIKHVYGVAKRWILYFTVAFTVSVYYVPALESLRSRLLPAACSAAFAILIEVLFSIDKRLRTDGEQHYETIMHAFPDIVRLAGSRGKHDVDIIVATGGTTVHALLPQLQTAAEESSATLTVRIQLMDPRSDMIRYMPTHHEQEVRVTLMRLAGFDTKYIKTVPVLYDYLPCVRGVLIDKKHLFLGFFSWVHNREQSSFSGANETHHYYRRQSKYEDYFTLFENWFSEAPKSSRDHLTNS